MNHDTTLGNDSPPAIAPQCTYCDNVATWESPTPDVLLCGDSRCHTAYIADKGLAIEYIDETVSAPPARAVDAEEPRAGVKRRAAAKAAIGWLALLGGLALLNMQQRPAFLQDVDAWLYQHISGPDALRLDVPMPPILWLSALLLLTLGMCLIGWSTAGLGRLSGMPSLVIRSIRSVGRPRLAIPWHALLLGGALALVGVVYATAVESTHWSILPLWLLALAAGLVYWWRTDSARGLSIWPSRVNRTVWLLMMVLVPAFIVTLYRLGDVPNSVWRQDEWFFLWRATGLAQGTQPGSPFGLGVFSAFPVVSSLYQSVWIRLFGLSLWSWRLGSVVIGTLTIVPLFFLTRKLLGSRVAWSMIALMICMPYFLAYTRLGYNNIQAVLPVTLGLWLIFEAAQRGSKALAYLSGVACGLASLTYSAGHVGLILCLGVCLFLYIKRKAVRRPMLQLACCLAVGWFFAAGPFVLGNMLGGRSVGWKAAESFVGNVHYARFVYPTTDFARLYPTIRFKDQDIFINVGFYVRLLLRGALLTTFHLIREGILTKHYIAGPLAGPVPALFLAGLAWMLGRMRRRLSIALWTVWALLPIVLLGVCNAFPPRPSHTVVAIPALAVFTAMGIWSLRDLVQQIFPIAPSRLLDWLGIGGVLAVALIGLYTYFVKMPQEYMPDLDNVMLWRAQELEPGSNLVFVADEPNFSAIYIHEWGIDTLYLQVSYYETSVEEVESTDFRALCVETCRVFFLPQHASQVQAHLYAQLGEGEVQQHVDSDGHTIGLEFVPPDNNR